MRRKPWRWIVDLTAIGLIAGAAYWLIGMVREAGRPKLMPAAVATSPAHIEVGKNVHVSAAEPTIDHMGCALAADPTNPQRLFAASTLGDNYADVAGYFSHDGGSTWQLGCKRPHKPNEQVADEDVAFGPDGALFFVNMRVPRDTPGKHRYGTMGVGNIDLACSFDGGQTWEERATNGRYIDRPCLTVDHTTGPNRGRLYIHATVEEPLLMTSGDSAKTISNTIHLAPIVQSTRPSNPIVLGDGTVLVTSAVFVTGGDTHQELPLLRSTDGGRTLTLVTSNLAGRWRHSRIKSGSMFDVFYPRLAVDTGSAKFAGRVYCVWRDGHGIDESYVLFASSRDGGATWTSPVIVSEQPAGADSGPDYGADIPAIAVNKDGILAVTWYDRRGLPKHTVGPDGVIPPALGYNARIRVSCDGGETWPPSVLLNEVPMRGDRLEARHWTGLAAAVDGRFHAAWIGDTTGKRQVWTAAISISPN